MSSLQDILNQVEVSGAGFYNRRGNTYHVFFRHFPDYINAQWLNLRNAEKRIINLPNVKKHTILNEQDRHSSHAVLTFEVKE